MRRWDITAKIQMKRIAILLVTSLFVMAVIAGVQAEGTIISTDVGLVNYEVGTYHGGSMFERYLKLETSLSEETVIARFKIKGDGERTVRVQLKNGRGISDFRVNTTAKIEVYDMQVFLE